MGVSMTTVRALRERGENAVHLREEGLQTLPDDEILTKAIDEHRIVLTFDLDFGDLLAASGAQTPSVLLFRNAKSDTGGRHAAEQKEADPVCSYPNA